LSSRRGYSWVRQGKEAAKMQSALNIPPAFGPVSAPEGNETGSSATAGALIWIAHIGIDRALGYGLKYATGFGDTHLGRIGRR
jgi:hypothetical protein